MNRQQAKPRQWLVSAEHVTIEASDLSGLEAEIREVVALLSRVGGAVTVLSDGGSLVIGAARQPLDTQGELYETTHFIFKWTPYLPSARRVEPAPDPEDEPDPDPDPVPDPPELVEAA